MIPAALLLAAALGAPGPARAGAGTAGPPAAPGLVAFSSEEAGLRGAFERGAGTAAGSAAALRLAGLECAAGRYAAADRILARAKPWPRPGDLSAQWLAWRGRVRLALGRPREALRDFVLVRRFRPASPEAAGALLGEADALRKLDRYARAKVLYRRLVPGPCAAQALWGLGRVYEREGRERSARECFERLLSAYPSSFEAASLAAHPAPPEAGPPPGRGAAWCVQVGAYSQVRWARALIRQLRSQGYRVRVQRRSIAGRALDLIQVGPYADASAAAAAARVLARRDHLPYQLVPQ